MYYNWADDRVCRTFTGAWIETVKEQCVFTTVPGRTFTGAWIETLMAPCTVVAATVAPSRVRGLKHVVTPAGVGCIGRTFTGAWIETLVLKQMQQDGISRTFTGAWIETLPF